MQIHETKGVIFWQRLARFGLPVCLALVLMGAWVWGVRGAPSTPAAGNTWYVDGATGVDDPACGASGAPCATISYALNTLVTGGDVIRVAQGAYVENLTVNISVTLEGGYESAGWTRDVSLYQTTIDGSGSQTVMGDWDGGQVRYPMVIEDSGTYKMWYNGYDLTGASRVGYATSSDGIGWTKHPSNPVLDLGSPGEWDADNVEAPFVIQEGPTTYKMWFSGWPACAIGYATSSDGIAWTRHPGNPVLAPGVETWNNDCAIHPFVLFEGGVYKMWLLSLGNDGSGQTPYLAYATSTDGIAWTWHAANPLFSNDWEGWMWRPDVFNNGGAYQLWYSAWVGEGVTGYATSPDGLTWSKNGSPVLSGTPGGWDEGNAFDPFVIYASGTYTMYYDNNHAIGLVNSNDGISWAQSGSNPLFTPGTPGQWGEPVVRFDPGSDGSILDGFTITGGDGSGGVWIDGTSVSVLNATVTGNTNNANWGGGIHVTNGANADIADSVIVNNLSDGAGGLGVMNNATVTLNNSDIQGNATTGGAGGGIGLWWGGVLHASDSVIADNVTQSSGGGIHVSGVTEAAYLTNSLVVENQANGGGAGIDNFGTTSLMNVTLANNVCSTGPDCTVGAGNFGPSPVLTITNSILASNAGSDLECPAGGCTVDYSDIGNNTWPGTGNISADPWFVDAANGDYHLQAWSPAIDSGTASGAPDHDLDGNSRPLNAGFDMGAYEFTGTPIVNAGIRYVAPSGSDAGLNLCLEPASPCQTVAYGLSMANSGESVYLAAGSYTENITVTRPVELYGGFEAAGWTRDIGLYETIIDGSGSVVSQSVITVLDSAGGSVLDGLTITGGSANMAGGVHGNGADLTIRNSLIHGNYANGGPSSQGAGGVLGGLGNSTLILENSRVVGNLVGEGAGGVRVHQGTLVITNTLIADNHGDAGIHVNGPLSMMHVTVADNDGGIVFNPPDGVQMTMANSIVYGNGGALWTNVGVIQVEYSDVEGGWAGAGNIDAPPEFVASASGDYHLLGSSPAIDTGTPANSPPADMEGTPRDVRPDMGALEFQRFDNDLAVIDALPGGTIAVNVAVPVRATLFNTGLLAQNNVPVNCRVMQGSSTVYNQTVNSGSLQPLAWQVLTFPAFTPSAQGAYTLTCTGSLTGDENTANDVYTRNLNVLNEFADVWTKDNPADNGNVPSDLNGWYQSPDLWVRNNNDGGLIHQDPIANTTNYVYVRLRNRGTVAITGTVDVYWIEPSLGVRCGDWAYIDTIDFSNLLPGEVRIVSTPWVPTRTGHTCLQDVIDSPDDPYNRALECSPLWVPWDNNVEWHNVNIVANPTGGFAGAVDIQQADVKLVNVYNLPKEVDLIIERDTFPDTGSITVNLPPALFDAWFASSNRWEAGVQVVQATKEIRITSPISATIGAIPMGAAEKASVGLTFDGPAGLAFEATFSERIDGVTVGGVTYQWVIPDTTPPSVQSVSPANGAAEVALNAPITITFNEPVSPLTFDLTFSSDPGGHTLYWSEDGTSVTIFHNDFAARSDYTLSVTASDGATNSMAAPYQWSFTTLTPTYYVYLPKMQR